MCTVSKYPKHPITEMDVCRYHSVPPFETRDGGFHPREGFPEFGADTPLAYSVIAHACMSRDPAERPSFAEVVEVLEEMGWQITDAFPGSSHTVRFHSVVSFKPIYRSGHPEYHLFLLYKTIFTERGWQITDAFLDSSHTVQSLSVVMFQPKHRSGQPECCLFLLYNTIFTEMGWQITDAFPGSSHTVRFLAVVSFLQ